MHGFRSILVLVPATGERPAVLERAARMARESGAALRLVAVVEDLPWYAKLVFPSADDLQGILVRDKRQALDTLAAPLRQEGLDVSTDVLTGRRHIEIVRAVLRGHHDLLIADAEPNEKALFGSTDMHLLRTCPCPIWIVKPEHGDRAFTRILAAVDPAPPPDESDLLHLKTEVGPKDPAMDVKILNFAGALATREGAELHIVHAWCAPGEGLLRSEPLLAPDQVERYVDESRTEARKALEHLLAGCAENPAGRTVHLIKGAPADVIAEFAKENTIDLIVMGTVARTGIPGMLIGNTAETILQRADCSVLAVKPQGFVSPVGLSE